MTPSLGTAVRAITFANRLGPAENAGRVDVRSPSGAVVMACLGAWWRVVVFVDVGLPPPPAVLDDATAVVGAALTPKRAAAIAPLRLLSVWGGEIVGRPAVLPV